MDLLFPRLSFWWLWQRSVRHCTYIPHPSAFIDWISLSWLCAAVGYAAIKHVSEMAASPGFCLCFVTIQNHLTQACPDPSVRALPKFCAASFLNYSLDMWIA